MHSNLLNYYFTKVFVQNGHLFYFVSENYTFPIGFHIEWDDFENVCSRSWPPPPPKKKKKQKKKKKFFFFLFF